LVHKDLAQNLSHPPSSKSQQLLCSLFCVFPRGHLCPSPDKHRRFIPGQHSPTLCVRRVNSIASLSTPVWTLASPALVRPLAELPAPHSPVRAGPPGHFRAHQRHCGLVYLLSAAYKVAASPPLLAWSLRSSLSPLHQPHEHILRLVSLLHHLLQHIYHRSGAQAGVRYSPRRLLPFAGLAQAESFEADNDSADGGTFPRLFVTPVPTALTKPGRVPQLPIQHRTQEPRVSVASSLVDFGKERLSPRES
jgi:hypothetical protein